MKVPSVDIDALDSIEPRSIQAYLEHNDWSIMAEAGDPYREIWKGKATDGRDAFLMLPTDKSTPDYSYRIYDLIRVISVAEGRAEANVFESIRSSAEIAKNQSRDIVSFSLKFEDVSKREVLASKLGRLLTGFQGLVSSLAQYAEGHPSAKGAIPKYILDKSQLSVASTFEGSFGLRFIASVPEEQLSILESPLIRESIKELFALLKASDDNELLKKSLIKLRKRAASNFRKFLIALSDLEVDSFIEWGSPDKSPSEQIEFSRLTVQKALWTVNRTIAETPDEFEIIAEWIGGNKRTRNFEVKDIEADDEVDGTYKGRISPNAIKDVEQAQISQIYKVWLLNEPELNEATEELLSKYTLLAIKSLPENAQDLVKN